MRAWLFVLAGCTGAAAPKPADDPGTVYDQVAARYAHARTCVDDGVISNSAAVPDADGAPVKFRYHLAFIRDDRWHVWFGTEGPELLIWADPKHTFVKMPDTPRQDLGADHTEAIGGLGEVSGGAATELLQLLLAKAERPAKLAWAQPPDPHTAHLRGEVHGEVIELVIDRDRGELRSATWWHGREKITLETKAVLDRDVPADALAMDDSAGVTTWLGIRTEDSPARVSQIVPGAPAAKAGVQIGDEVVSIDGKPIANAKEVVAHASTLKVNKPAPIVVRRKGADVPLTVTPEPRPDPSKVQATFVGKPAPSLSLSPLGGGAPITLTAGQVTVLDFWATWCGPCTVVSPHLEQLAKQFPKLRVIGISDEDEADIAAFLAKHKVSYTLARDPDDRATKDYLVQGLPTVIVIDKAGVVRWATVGVPSFPELDAAVAAAVR